MFPALVPGDGLLVLRSSRPRPGQLRVFPDPRRPGPISAHTRPAHPGSPDFSERSRWLVKRVEQVRGTGPDTVFRAVSDNADSPGVIDSRHFGWVPAAGSYRVVFRVRGAQR